MNLGPIESDFAELFSNIAVAQGMDPLIAKIFSLAYVNQEDLALDEIAKKTGYSLASISNKVNMFEAHGMFKKIRKPGTKKIFIRTEKNILRMMKYMMVKKEQHGLNRVIENLPIIIKKHKSNNPNEEQLSKIKILEDYLKQIKLIKEAMQKAILGFEKTLKEYEK